MSQTYIPLYRKYRPQTFADLIGQESITQALSNAIKLNKVAHAYLFCGPRGTGKTSSARILAKSLNCLNGPTTEPCGKCPSCIDITNATPVDVIEIDAASNRSVEDAQNIIEKIHYVPIHGKYKIYIIDEVHMLSATAFNALLKTLEEPPENVIFILATTEAHKVIETIVSRCQRFDFRRITVDDIVKRLEYISQKEEINISKDALSAIAKSVQGGMRDALALLDQLSILDVKKQITVEDVENLLGKISTNALFDLTEKIISNNAQDAILEINKIYSKGNEPLQILSNLIEYFRNLLVIKECTDKETVLSLTQLSEDLVEKLSSQARSIDTSAINYAIDRLAAYLREIRNSTDRYLWLEVCIIELANKLSAAGFSDLLNRIETLEKALSGNMPAQTQVRRTPPVSSAPSFTSAVSTPAAPQTPSVASAPSAPIEPVKEVQRPSFNEPVMQVAPNVVKEAEPSSVPSPEKEQPSATADLQPEINKPAAEITAQHIEKEQTPDLNRDDNTTDTALEPLTAAPQSENGIELWDTLLSKFTSLPGKMFFANLSCPVMISPNKIIIGFTKEVFVTQSREAGRMAPLKAAITELFGNADMPVEIRHISEAEAEAFKAGAKKKSIASEPVTKPNSEPSSISQASQGEKTESSDDEYYEKQLENSPSRPASTRNYSDQAKMILELFNGKYMD